MPTTVKWTMTPERFAVVFRVVCGTGRVGIRYAGRAEDVRFAIEHKAEFFPAITPAGFMERNQIEVVEEKNG